MGLALASPFVSSLAVAQSSGDKAAAEALFVEGRKLMEAGRYVDACPKFEASQRLDPGVGTMLNLAECYEKVGRTASAWAEFREVISAARAADSKEREALARERAAALESKLSRLTIALSAEASATPGIEIRRDGAVVDSAELGTSIPVDPGKHVIEANAPGRQKWYKTVELNADNTQAQVLVPALTAVVDNTGPGTSGGVNVDAGTSSSSGSTQRTIAVVTGAVGVVGLAVGTVYGLQASSKWDDAKKGCTDYPYGCSGKAVDEGDQAKKFGTLSTVGFAVGAVGLAAGAVLWFTAGSKTEQQASVGVGLGNIVVKGRF
ncbi:MAG: tetratricopeptide repeat protein [Myxococcota bacterium]